MPYLIHLAVLLVISAGSLIFFLRDPERVPPGGDVILSPADGRIVEITQEGEWTKIAVFMNFRNVHVQWAPYPGRVLSIERLDGPARPAFLPEASGNKRVVSTIETKLGKIILKQIVGILVRRIETFSKTGDEVKVGQRFGRIIFGSRVELWLPKDKINLTAQKGQKVLAGKTILASPHPFNNDT
jgi:phosphatidylserine decarboxylase